MTTNAKTRKAPTSSYAALLARRDRDLARRIRLGQQLWRLRRLEAKLDRRLAVTAAAGPTGRVVVAELEDRPDRAAVLLGHVRDMRESVEAELRQGARR